MRVSCVILVFGLSACTQLQKPSIGPPTQPKETLLDEILLAPAYSTSVAQAESDLPEDNWVNEPWRQNVSREKRTADVADKMLKEIQPKLKSMTVTQLAKALKLVPCRSLSVSFSGVAYYLYMDGNQMILSEIRSRPRRELGVLRHFATDKLEVFEGAQGSGDTLAQVVDGILGSRTSAEP